MKRDVIWVLGIILVTGSLVYAGSPGSAQSEIELIRQQAVKGDPGDQLLYGLAIIDGRYGLDPDIASGMSWIKRAADGGDNYAAMVLGKAYAQGKGVKKDPVKAVLWWRKAADGDNTEAKYHLAMAYMEGKGVAKDLQKAGSWLKQAADEGSADAQYQLGQMHSEGVVVEKDQDTAMEWLRRAADNGHLEAVHLLGVIESMVKAATPLTQESYNALHQRAIENDPHAQFELALRYENGSLDVNADPAKALLWLTKAAENGNVLAMHRLARVYKNGDLGVSKDEAKHRYWLDKARLQNSKLSD